MKVGEVYDPFEQWRGEVPPWLRRLPSLGPGPKLCFAYLSRFSGAEGPTMEITAKELGVSVRQAMFYLRDLRTLGLLKTERKGPGKGCVYVFLWPYQAEHMKDTSYDETKYIADVAAEDVKDTSDVAPPVVPSPPSALPPLPPITPQGRTLASQVARPKTAAQRETTAVRDPGKDYGTKQALQIATEKVCRRFRVRWQEVRPDAPAPALIPDDRVAVKKALEGIASADGSDFLAAEEQLCGFAETLAEAGKPLHSLRFTLNDLRNGGRPMNGKKLAPTMREEAEQLLSRTAK